MKILMVCLGNICRSPLAEGIMKEKIKKYNLDVEVDSAGTAAYHLGEQPDPRSIEIARKNGIDITYQRARRFTRSDFDHFDIILAMDRSNYLDLRAMARNDAEKSKIEFILNNAEPGSDKSVPDPYYGGKDGFEDVYKMLDTACENLAQSLNKNPKK